jgi:hypothetical protein
MIYALHLQLKIKSSFKIVRRKSKTKDIGCVLLLTVYGAL